MIDYNRAVNELAIAIRQGIASPFIPISKGFQEAQSIKPYTLTRGILIDRRWLDRTPIDLNKGYYFQFNPAEIDDSKVSSYEVRPYAGLPYNDYIWSGGGERTITFQLFLDNTPASKTISFRPESYGSKIADTIAEGGASKDVTEFTWREMGAYSRSRVSERGILPEVELIQSFLYPTPIGNDPIPLFAEGGVVSASQFRPPPIVVFALGPLYLEGVIKSAPVKYSLFDTDLTPLRGTIDIEFGVFEFDTLKRRIG